MASCAATALAGSARSAMRPSASMSTSATSTVRTGSMVTTVPPRIASTVAAAVRRAGIRRQQQRHVVVLRGCCDLELYGHSAEERGHLDKVGGGIELDGVHARIEHGQVGDAAIGVGQRVCDLVVTLPQR